MPGDPFHVDSAARPLLSWLLRLDAYRALYEQIRSTPEGPFEARALEVLDIRPSWSQREVEAIPQHEPKRGRCHRSFDERKRQVIHCGGCHRGNLVGEGRNGERAYVLLFHGLAP